MGDKYSPKGETQALSSTDAFSARLRKAALALNLSQAELARRASVPFQTINKYWQGGSACGADRLFDLASALEVNPRWLATGLGFSNASVDDDRIALPEFDIAYSMGRGAVLEDYAEQRTVELPRHWLQPLIRGNFNQVFVTRGEGDSMQPTLLDGDVIVVDGAQQSMNSQDRIWAISYGDLGMIKRLRAMPDGSIDVISDNQTIAPFRAYDGELNIIGRVVWIGRRA